VTDAHYPERWLNDRRLLRLSDGAHRLFVVALTWAVANRTDGVLEDADLPLIPGADPRHYGELTDAGLWQRFNGAWLITVFEETQTSSAQLEHLSYKRRLDRERQRRKRTRDRDRAVTRDVTQDVTADHSRTGQARTGT
jgi:hypothetical protein